MIEVHNRRTAEEEAGIIHWLRPDYQIRRFGDSEAVAPQTLGLEAAAAETDGETPRPWPDSAAEQIAALKEVIADGPRTVEETASAFHNARRALVCRHLDTLVLVGEFSRTNKDKYEMAPEVGSPA